MEEFVFGAGGRGGEGAITDQQVGDLPACFIGRKLSSAKGFGANFAT
jgi:hypothetical protein